MSKNKYKPTILIDLDGVLNTYNGNYIEGYIPPIKEGAKEFLESIYKNYSLILFTTREKQHVQKWLNLNEIAAYFEKITSQKLPAYLIIDDRCICFNGNYSSLSDNIKNFIPWNKK